MALPADSSRACFHASSRAMVFERWASVGLGTVLALLSSSSRNRFMSAFSAVVHCGALATEVLPGLLVVSSLGRSGFVFDGF